MGLGGPVESDDHALCGQRATARRVEGVVLDHGALGAGPDWNGRCILHCGIRLPVVDARRCFVCANVPVLRRGALGVRALSSWVGWVCPVPVVAAVLARCHVPWMGAAVAVRVAGSRLVRLR